MFTIHGFKEASACHWEACVCFSFPLFCCFDFLQQTCRSLVRSFCFDRWRSTGAITIDHHVGLKGGGRNGVTSSSVILYLFNNIAQPPQGQGSRTNIPSPPESSPNSGSGSPNWVTSNKNVYENNGLESLRRKCDVSLLSSFLSSDFSLYFLEFYFWITNVSPF